MDMTPRQPATASLRCSFQESIYTDSSSVSKGLFRTEVYTTKRLLIVLLVAVVLLADSPISAVGDNNSQYVGGTVNSIKEGTEGSLTPLVWTLSDGVLATD